MGICTLGYWNGRTFPAQCKICKLLKRDNKETADAMRANPSERWKMNSYNKAELRAALDKEKGLGDMVHAVAQPIARVIDKVFKTNIQGCGGCKKRRSRLNSLSPERREIEELYL